MRFSSQIRAYTSFSAALFFCLCALVSPRTANASEDFPALLQAALDKYSPGKPHCVPLCTACHNTTRGGPGDPNAFGKELETNFGLVLGENDTVDTAIKNLVAASPAPDADMDGTSDIDEINAGNSPSLASPAGIDQFCPDITYGCGAHIAAAPPKDRLSLIPAGMVVLGMLGLRRRKTQKSLRPSKF